jgi:opacity protein-like surface antigen
VPKQHRRSFRSSLIVCVALFVLPAQLAFAEADEGWSVGGGIGFTASPTSFLMQFDAPYHFGNGASVGPQMQFGVTGDTTIVSGAINGRYDFDILSGNSNGLISKLTPFVNGGIGFSYIKNKRVFRNPFISNSGTGFLMEFGGGIAYRLSDHVSLESAMQLNIIPDGAGPGDNDHFYYSWQMLGARLHF